MNISRIVALLVFAASVVFFAPLGNAQSRGVQVTVRDKAGTSITLYEESHALVIGVAEYTGGWPRLRGIAQDVAEVKTALERHGFKVTVVMDPDRRGLDDAFQDFISRFGQKPENRLLFYFAGHGHTMRLAYGGQMGYLVPREAPNPNIDPQGFLRTAVSMQTIEVHARNIQSKHAIFLFDSCFSGAIFDATRAIPDIIAEKTGRPVRQFITSGAADQQVPDQSVFRGQFVAGIQGEADLDGDGYVTGAELGQFLENKVTNYTRRAQTPQYGKLRDPLLDKGDFVFALPGKAKTTPEPARIPDDRKGMDQVFWESVKDAKDKAPYEEYLRQFPNGTFAGLARIRIEEVGRAEKARVDAAKTAPAPAPPAKTTVDPAVLKELGARISAMNETPAKTPAPAPAPSTERKPAPLVYTAKGPDDPLLKLAESRKAVLPDSAATVLDRDGDGILDNEDKCPTLAGLKGRQGCPITIFSGRKVVILERIRFDQRKAEIPVSQRGIVMDICAMIVKNPGIGMVRIEGNTDSHGKPAENRALGTKRALLVRDSLVKCGVDPSRLDVTTNGEQEPIADNNAAEGRAENNRVDFVLPMK